MEELREENNSLRQVVAGKDSEIRHLNDEISELFLKLRLNEQNQVGMLTQLKHQTESEAIIMQAQKDHGATITSLSDRCNKLFAENEDLRARLADQKTQLEREMSSRMKSLEDLRAKLNEEKERMVPKEQFALLEAKYNDLLVKHKKLLKVQITSVLEDKSLQPDKEIFNVGVQLDYLASQISQLRTTNT